MNTENQQNEQSTPVENIQIDRDNKFEITQEIRTNLHTTAKWSQFLAILGFVGMGFMVFAGLIMSVVMSVMPGDVASDFPFPPFLLGAIYIIMAAIYLFPLLYLYRFSSGIRNAFNKNNQEYLSNAFANLKSHYKTVGIIMIVFLCLYPIMIVGMIVFGIFSGMSGGSGFPV